MGLLKRDIMGNPFCQFCSTLKFERTLLNERCGAYNARSHVKSIRAYSGVILNNYLVDHRKWIYEKKTKTFSKIRFCPLCGFDYVKSKQYDGELYIDMDFNKLLNTMEKNRRKK